MRTYLCGAINGRTDAECNDWRTYAKEQLRGETVDPMRRDYRGREDGAVREIVEGDKEDIAGCQFVLVNAVQPSWGTAMEILFAWNRGRKIAAFAGDGTVSPWIRYHCTHITVTAEEAVAWINDRIPRQPEHAAASRARIGDAGSALLRVL